MKLSLAPVMMRRGIGGATYPARPACRPSRSSLALQTQHSPCRQHLSRRPISNTTSLQSHASPNPSPSENPSTDQSNKSSSQLDPLLSTPTPSISEQVRLLMRRVPYPVAIITATDPTGPSDATAFRGMTVSSFNTVTLTPHPVISFNVRRPSETLNALLSSGRFLVHLLAPGSATATLAKDFSKGNSTLAAMLSGHGDFEFGALSVTSEQGGSQEREREREQERPLPILRRRAESSDQRNVDFPFVFECALHPSKIDVHDHSIVLGTVVRTIEQTSSQEALDNDSPDRLCLTYANTRFWKMGTGI